MIINESGLTRAIKKAYRFGGYTVFRRGEMLTVYCDQWCVQCEREIFSRKALGAIVEHAGFMPDDGEAYQISKSGEPQVEDFYMAVDTAGYWSSAEQTQEAEVTTLTFCGYQLMQDVEPDETEGFRRLHGANLGGLEILEWPVVRDKRAVIADGCRAVYSADKELVSLGLISHRTFQEEERRLAIWQQLEKVDLRPRKDQQE